MSNGLLPHHTLMVIPGEYCREMGGWHAGRAQLCPRLGPTPPPPKKTDGSGRRWREGEGAGIKVREVRPPWGMGPRVGAG